MKKLYERLRSGRSPAPINNPQEETNREPAPSDTLRSIADPNPPEQPSALSFPDGVEVLHDCPDATVDICFVHGLTGNRISTWTAHGQTAPWPKTLLPEKLTKARILTYGYDAYIVSKTVASSNQLIDHATNLLTDLTNDRAGSRASSRPLIFVAHSLGGLVCKEAILQSRNNPNHRRRDIFAHLKGIVFMGTPHKGSWMADWAKMPASALGLIKSTNKSLLRILETDDQLLESIQARFLALVREQREAGRQLEVTCFFEELPLPVVGKVVSKESATFEGYDPITIHANHGDMVKFKSAEENGFKRLVGELIVWELEIGRSISAPEAVTPQAHVETNTAMGKEGVAPAKHTMHYLPFPRTSNMASRPARPNSRRGFETAIICALPLEADAVEALFDRHWDDDDPPFNKAPGDPNAYSTGVIGRHNVVLAYMPGMGKANAAAVASNCRASFPSIRLALVVGVCGVVPFGPHKEEIVLGDVIISDGIIQYDFGRQLPGRFIRKDTLGDALGRPNQEIRSALTKLKTLRGRQQLGSKVAGYLDVLRQEPELQAEYPGSANDKLFEASYSHAEDQQSCEQLGCDGELVPRSRLKAIGADPTPAIYSGLMASGDSVMKSGEDRDRIAAEDGIIAFEMEGAGVWDNFPCIVIKGACDYADSHKSKVWQRYAAATAAACMKAFLSHWVPSIPAGGEVEDSGIRGR